MGPFPALPRDAFDIVHAALQRPVAARRAGERRHRGAVRRCPTVTLDRLEDLDVPGIAAENGPPFPWSTNPRLDRAIDPGEAWGFAWAAVAFMRDKARVMALGAKPARRSTTLAGPRGAMRTGRPHGVRPELRGSRPGDGQAPMDRDEASARPTGTPDDRMVRWALGSSRPRRDGQGLDNRRGERAGPFSREREGEGRGSARRSRAEVPLHMRASAGTMRSARGRIASAASSINAGSRTEPCRS